MWQPSCNSAVRDNGNSGVRGGGCAVLFRAGLDDHAPGISCRMNAFGSIAVRGTTCAGCVHVVTCWESTRSATTVISPSIVRTLTCFDADRRPEAGRRWRLAEVSATEAGDPVTLAYVRYCRHRQARHIGDDSAALKLIRSAREGVERVATPTVMAEFWGNEAATLAGLHSLREARAALGAAESAFAHS